MLHYVCVCNINYVQNKPKNEFISTIELAKLLGISRVTVFRLIKKGRIPAKKSGVILLLT